MVKPFEVVGQITSVETIAVGSAIREIERLREQFGIGRWRKLKDVANVKLTNGKIRLAELHWYEAMGVESANLR